MKLLYIVCLLLALACIVVMPAPAPQPIGPFGRMFGVATSFVKFFPAALQTGMQVVENVAQKVDNTLLGLTGSNGGPNTPAARSYGSTINTVPKIIPKIKHTGIKPKIPKIKESQLKG